MTAAGAILQKANDTTLTDEQELSDSDKFSCSNSFFDTGIQPQVFGGLGIDLAFFQIAVNLSYNMRSYYTSGSVLLAFKL